MEKIKKLCRNKEFQWFAFPILTSAALSLISNEVIRDLYPIVVGISGVQYIPYVQVFPFMILIIGLLPSVYIAIKHIGMDVNKES